MARKSIDNAREKSLLAILGIILILFTFGCGKQERNILGNLQKDQKKMLAFKSGESLDSTEVYAVQMTKVNPKTQVESEKREIKPNDKQITTTKVNESYLIQLACLRNLERTIKIQKKLKLNGYETNISKRYRNKKPFYRLRMVGNYSLKDANNLGNEIINRFPEFREFLVLKK